MCYIHSTQNNLISCTQNGNKFKKKSIQNIRVQHCVLLFTKKNIFTAKIANESINANFDAHTTPSQQSVELFL